MPEPQGAGEPEAEPEAKADADADAAPEPEAEPAPEPAPAAAAAAADDGGGTDKVAGDEALQAEAAKVDEHGVGAYDREEDDLRHLSVVERLAKQPDVTISFANGETLDEPYKIKFEKFVGNDDYMLYDRNNVPVKKDDQIPLTLYSAVAPTPLVYAKLDPLEGGEHRAVKVSGDGLELLKGKVKGVLIAIREDDPFKAGVFNLAKMMTEEYSLAQIVSAKRITVDRSMRDKAMGVTCCST